MLARFSLRTAGARYTLMASRLVPVVAFPRHSRSFSMQAQKITEVPDVATFVNFVHMDHEGAPWGEYAAALVQKRARRDPEKTRKLAFLALAFREFDANQDNVLSKDELKLGLISMGLPSEDADVSAVFKALDANKDKVIQLDEWLDHLPITVANRLEEHAKAESWRKLAWGEDSIAGES